MAGAEERGTRSSSDRDGRIYRLAVPVPKLTYNLVISFHLLANLHRGRERERETSGNRARGLVMLDAKVDTRLVVPFKGIQLCSACECLLNPIN